MAWRDRVVESHPDSYPTSSTDTLMWWTPVLGPTAALMAHRFAGHVASAGQVQFDLGDLARTLGLGRSTSRVRTSIARLERFDIVSVEDATVFVRLSLPPLTRRHLGQLPPYLVELYLQRHPRGV